MNATLATASGTWAVLPMGLLDQPLNTFWQLFFRPLGSTEWSLATPPGIALNGGLAVTQPGNGVLTAGIEPSNLLTYSPLAQRRPAGGPWQPGIVPGALAPVPDALASSPGDGLLALLRNGGGEVVHSSGDPSTWTALVSRRQLGAAPGATACQISALTSVAFSVAKSEIVGTKCAKPGLAGIFIHGPTGWVVDGPALPRSEAGGDVTVLRLWAGSPGGSSLSGLLSARNETSDNLLAVWAGSGGRRWVVSAVLPVVPGEQLLSTGSAPGGRLFLVLKEPSGSIDLESALPGTPWQELRDLPVGTATVAFGPRGALDALAASTYTFTDWRYAPAGHSWTRAQTIHVPISIGSSS